MTQVQEKSKLFLLFPSYNILLNGGRWLIENFFCVHKYFPSIDFFIIKWTHTDNIRNLQVKLSRLTYALPQKNIYFFKMMKCSEKNRDEETEKKILSISLLPGLTSFFHKSHTFSYFFRKKKKLIKKRRVLFFWRSEMMKKNQRTSTMWFFLDWVFFSFLLLLSSYWLYYSPGKNWFEAGAHFFFSS